MRQALVGTVLLQVPASAPESAELVAQHRVRSVPTFVLLDHEGEPLQSWVGYGDAAEWGAQVAAVKQDPVTLAARRARFESAPAFGDAVVLATDALRAGRCREAERYLRRAAELDPQAARAEGVPLRLFRAAFRGVEGGEYEVPEVLALAEALLSGEALAPEHALEIANTLAGVARETGIELVAPLIAMARPRVEQLPPGAFARQRQQYEIHHALFVEGDAARAVRLMRESLPPGWESDPEALNEFAWWCFTQQVGLTEAEALAQRGVELSAPGPGRANVLDTLAELVHARGDRGGAAELIRRALAEDPQNEYLLRQLARFSGGETS